MSLQRGALFETKSEVRIDIEYITLRISLDPPMVQGP